LGTSTPLSQKWTDPAGRKSVITVELNRNINQLDKTGIYRLIQHEQNTHFSQAHMEYPPKQTTFSHKAHLNEFKRTEIIQCLFSDPNSINLQINNIKITGKIPKYREIKQHISK